MSNGVDGILHRAVRVLELLLSVQTEQAVFEPGSGCFHVARGGRMLTPRERRLWNSAVLLCDDIFQAVEVGRAGGVGRHGEVEGCGSGGGGDGDDISSWPSEEGWQGEGGGL